MLSWLVTLTNNALVHIFIDKAQIETINIVLYLLVQNMYTTASCQRYVGLPMFADMQV